MIVIQITRCLNNCRDPNLLLTSDKRLRFGSGEDVQVEMTSPLRQGIGWRGTIA